MIKKRKSEVGMPNAEVRTPDEQKAANLPADRQDRKRKAFVRSEEETHSAFDILHSEIKNHSALDIPHSALQELQTEQMEVHHHPEVEKKGFKEYILEGLMIFLAVTMGFFAETIREGISDRAKGMEYIKSFVQDLRRDTATFSGVIVFDTKKLVALNNIFACYYSIEKNSGSTGCLVPIMKSSTSNRVGNFTDGTQQQLKNAGGFRLLNKNDKDSIVAYDHAARAFQNFESTIFQQRQDIVRDISVKLVDFKAEPMLFPDSIAGNVQSPLLFSNDKALINEYFNDLLLYRRVIMTQSAQLDRLSKRAVGLIRYFDNKYELGNE
jgi:hypothetical protein